MAERYTLWTAFVLPDGQIMTCFGGFFNSVEDAEEADIDYLALLFGHYDPVPTEDHP